MKIVAHVFNVEVTETELDFEEHQIKKQFPQLAAKDIRICALQQLIDRYIIMHEAIKRGMSVTDSELEAAMIDLLDDIGSPGTETLVNRRDTGKELERILKSFILDQKFMEYLEVAENSVTDDKLRQFYDERKDFFNREEEVRASHLLIKGQDEAAYTRIREIRDGINCCEDFAKYYTNPSECPTDMNCGDLGFFPQGRMIPEIEKIAFSLNKNEISTPFLTKYGYHILMVTDRKDKQIIPFEAIKDCLRESLIEIELELARNKILTEIKEQCQKAIQISENALK